MKQSNHGLSSNRQIHTSSLPWQCPRRWLDVEGRKPHGGHRKTEWFNHLLTAIDLVVHTKTNESQHLHVSMCHIHIEYICVNTYNKHTYYIHMHIYIQNLALKPIAKTRPALQPTQRAYNNVMDKIHLSQLAVPLPMSKANAPCTLMEASSLTSFIDVFNVATCIQIILAMHGSKSSICINMYNLPATLQIWPCLNSVP